MDLNAIRRLSKEQLTQIVSQSGHVEIAQILDKLDSLNGDQLLNITEFQTINWKIMPLQRKQLLAFIRQLKSNAITLKISRSVSAMKTLPISRKPAPPVEKKPLQPQFLTTKGTKSPESEIATVGKINKKAFALELEKVFGETTDTANNIKTVPAIRSPIHQQRSSFAAPKKEKLPLPKQFEVNKHQEKDEYYMTMSSESKDVNYGYMSPNDILEETYENLKPTYESERKYPSVPPPEDVTDFFTPPPRILPRNQPDIQEPEDTYEPPPRIGLTKNPPGSLPLHSRVKLGSLPTVQTPDDEEEENNYEQVPDERQKPHLAAFFRSKIDVKARSISPKKNHEYNPAPNRSIPSVSPVANRKPIPTPTRNDPPSRTDQKKKISSNDYLSLLPAPKETIPDSIALASSYDQHKRDNGALKQSFSFGDNNNTVGKSRIKMNYETYHTRGETKLKTNSILNRPLPKIPDAREHIGNVKSSVYVELTKNNKINYGTSKEYVHDDDRHRKCEQSDEPTEYENSPILYHQRDQVANHNQNKTSGLSNKKAIQDSLVLQLASELNALNKIRPTEDPEDHLPEYGNTLAPVLCGNTIRKETIRGRVKTPPPPSRIFDSRNEPVRINPRPALPKPPVITGPQILVPQQPIGEHSDESDDDYVHNIFNINNETYFRNTDRKGAKLLLRGLEDGAFLFRPSQHYFLVLTIKCDKKFYNLGIERTTNDKIKLSSDTGSVAPEFSTLKKFVEYFSTEAVTFQDDGELKEIYLKPALTSDQF